MEQRGDLEFVELVSGQAHFLRNQSGIFGDAPRVTASVRVLFVDGRGEHADGADEQLAIFLGGFLQALDVFLDVAGHQVEVFGKFADFRGAAYGRALVELSAADGARGRGQSTNRLADAHGEKVTKEHGHQHDDADERERLAVQLGDAGIRAGFIQAALRHDGPVHFGESTVGAHHFDGAILVFFRETKCFGIAQFLGQGLDFGHQRGLVAQVLARHEVLGVGVRHDMPVVIDNENGAPPHAGVLQAVKNGIERNHRGQHPGEIVANVLQGHRDDKRRSIVRSQRQRIAAKLRGLHAADKRALQRLSDEGVLFRAEIPLRGAGAFAVATHRGEVDEGVAIRFDEVLQQPSDFWLRDRVLHVFAEAGEIENLALADQLLCQVGFKKLYFLGKRAGQLGLLHALHVDELFLAEFKHLAMIQTDRQGADQQQRSEHKPENAHPTGAQARNQD